MDQVQLVQLIKTIVTTLDTPAEAARVPVGVSNRHVHLSQPDVEKLFGAGHQLQPERELSQPGYYAARETVLLAGPKGAIPGVRVLGPTRAHTQVELLWSDTFSLGVKTDIRESGRRAQSGPITIVGPVGTIIEDRGVLVAKRHLHTNPDDAHRLGLQEGQLVAVRTGGDRAALLEEVVVRIGEGIQTELHLDTEEANAAAVKNGQTVELVLWPNKRGDGIGL